MSAKANKLIILESNSNLIESTIIGIYKSSPVKIYTCIDGNVEINIIDGNIDNLFDLVSLYTSIDLTILLEILLIDNLSIEHFYLTNDEFIIKGHYFGINIEISSSHKETILKVEDKVKEYETDLVKYISEIFEKTPGITYAKVSNVSGMTNGALLIYSLDLLYFYEWLLKCEADTRFKELLKDSSIHILKIK